MQLIFIADGNAHDFNRRSAVFQQAHCDIHTKIKQVFPGADTVGAFEQSAEVAAIDIAIGGQAINRQMFVVAIFNFFDRPLQMPGFVIREEAFSPGVLLISEEKKR